MLIGPGGIPQHQILDALRPQRDLRYVIACADAARRESALYEVLCDRPAPHPRHGQREGSPGKQDQNYRAPKPPPLQSPVPATVFVGHHDPTPAEATIDAVTCGTGIPL